MKRKKSHKQAKKLVILWSTAQPGVHGAHRPIVQERRPASSESPMRMRTAFCQPLISQEAYMLIIADLCYHGIGGARPRRQRRSSQCHGFGPGMDGILFG